MPNRILKESILDSPTLARLPDFTQDQFPRLLLLADDWGCFNADPDAIKGRAYPKRPKVTPKVVNDVLMDFYKNGMLFLWTDGERIYGYWTGWDAHNYCNGSAVTSEGKQDKHRRKTPIPPADLLEQYVKDHQNKLEQVRTNTLIPIPIPIPIPNKRENTRARETAPETPPPETLEITDKMQEWATTEGFTEEDIRRETPKMLDHFRGINGKKADWTATWRNWLRNSRGKFAPRPSSNGPPSRAAPRKPTEAEIERERQALFGNRK